MIRLPRMTIAALKQSMDRRFTRLDRRLRRQVHAIDQRFESVSEKIDAVLTQTTVMRDQFVRVADEHEYRIRDPEVRLPR